MLGKGSWGEVGRKFCLKEGGRKDNYREGAIGRHLFARNGIVGGETFKREGQVESWLDLEMHLQGLGRLGERFGFRWRGEVRSLGVEGEGVICYYVFLNLYYVFCIALLLWANPVFSTLISSSEK